MRAAEPVLARASGRDAALLSGVWVVSVLLVRGVRLAGAAVSARVATVGQDLGVMRSFRLVLCLAACLVRATAVGPVEYAPLDGLELALQADVILEGTIVALHGEDPAGPDTFELAVADVIAGPKELERAQVAAFRDWMCATRYAPYAVGQRAIFFLQHPRDDRGRIAAGPLRVMGAGNDGECPMDEGEVLHSWAGADVHPVRARGGFGDSAWIVTQRPEFVAAVTGLRECFAWHRRAGPDPYPELRLVQTCTDAELWSRMDADPLLRSAIRSSGVYQFGTRLEALRERWDEERDRGQTPLRRWR